MINSDYDQLNPPQPRLLASTKNKLFWGNQESFLCFRESTILHLDLPSTCIHQDSPEGKAQLLKERAEATKNRRKSTVADTKKDDSDNGDNEKEKRKRKVPTFASNLLLIINKCKCCFNRKSLRRQQLQQTSWRLKERERAPGGRRDEVLGLKIMMMKKKEINQSIISSSKSEQPRP